MYTRLRVVATAICLVGVAYAIRFKLQPSLLYFPRTYIDDDKHYRRIWNDAFDKSVAAGYELIQIKYTDAGFSRSCYVLRSSLPKSAPLWIVHGGNSMLAWDWLPLIVQSLDVRSEQASYLLVDYPGFGKNEPQGSTPDSEYAVLSNALSALGSVTSMLTAEGRKIREVNLMGHSLGSAVSVSVANYLLARDFTGPEVGKLILSAPFISIPRVAQSLFGPFPEIVFRAACSQVFDNEAGLIALRQLDKSLKIVIIHGAQDEIVPILHGRYLQSLIKGVSLVEVRDASHNDILDTDEFMNIVLRS